MNGWGDTIVIIASILNFTAAMLYFGIGDLPRTFYWIGAFVLTMSTIFIRK